MENYPKKFTMTAAFEVIYVSPEPMPRKDALRKAKELGGRFPTQIEALVIANQARETVRVPFYTRDMEEFFCGTPEGYKGMGYCYPTIRAVGSYEQEASGMGSYIYALIVKSL